MEPASRADSTYVLQEYFVPIDQFDRFLPRLRDVRRRRGVNVINVSIRRALADPGLLLAWARTVLYYKQGTSRAARDEVEVWTGADRRRPRPGRLLLPSCQLNATEEQFLRAYPGAPEFFALKRRLDPTGKFRNALWDKFGARAAYNEVTDFPPEREEQ